MKEQDAAHSVDKKDANLCPVMTGEYCFNRGCGINHERQCLMLNRNDKKSDVPSTLDFQEQHIEVLKAELTRLRSELAEYKARLRELIFKRKQDYHKDCLNDNFINGRFWEAQELLELIDKL